MDRCARRSGRGLECAHRAHPRVDALGSDQARERIPLIETSASLRHLAPPPLSGDRSPPQSSFSRLSSLSGARPRPPQSLLALLFLSNVPSSLPLLSYPHSLFDIFAFAFQPASPHSPFSVFIHLHLTHRFAAFDGLDTPPTGLSRLSFNDSLTLHCSLRPSTDPRRPSTAQRIRIHHAFFQRFHIHAVTCVS